MRTIVNEEKKEILAYFSIPELGMIKTDIDALLQETPQSRSSKVKTINRILKVAVQFIKMQGFKPRIIYPQLESVEMLHLVIAETTVYCLRIKYKDKE